MAILILAVVTLISLAIGAIVVRELRLSTNIDRSITAYYVAESGIEWALNEVMKEPSVNIEDLIEYLDEQDGCMESFCDYSKWKLDLLDFPGPVSLSGSLSKDQTKEITIPKNLADRVVFTLWDPEGAWLQYRLISWETETDTDNDEKINPDSINIDEGLCDKSCIKSHKISDTEITIPLGDLLTSPSASDKNHILKFKPLQMGARFACEVRLGDNLIELTEERADIISTGTYLDTKRAIEVFVVSTAGLGGKFNYVIFSTEDLYKRYGEPK